MAYVTSGNTPCSINRKARMIEEYLSGSTPRELRIKFDLALKQVQADLGVYLWSCGSTVTHDRPEIVARMADPLTKRSLAVMIKYDRHAGASVGRLSAEYELAVGTIRYLIAVADAEILSRIRAGEPAHVIGRELGVNVDQVSDWIRTVPNTPRVLAAATGNALPDMPGPRDFQVTNAAVVQYRKALGSALRARRTRRQLTPRDAARRIGLSVDMVRRQENGSREVPSSLLLKYAALYRVSPATLVAEAFAEVIDRTRAENRRARVETSNTEGSEDA